MCVRACVYEDGLLSRQQFSTQHKHRVTALIGLQEPVTSLLCSASVMLFICFSLTLGLGILHWLLIET